MSQDIKEFITWQNTVQIFQLKHNYSQFLRHDDAFGRCGKVETQLKTVFRISRLVILARCRTTLTEVFCQRRPQNNFKFFVFLLKRKYAFGTSLVFCRKLLWKSSLSAQEKFCNRVSSWEIILKRDSSISFFKAVF